MTPLVLGLPLLQHPLLDQYDLGPPVIHVPLSDLANPWPSYLAEGFPLAANLCMQN